jgi:hypothetical protein
MPSNGRGRGLRFKIVKSREGISVETLGNNEYVHAMLYIFDRLFFFMPLLIAANKTARASHFVGCHQVKLSVLLLTIVYFPLYQVLHHTILREWHPLNDSSINAYELAAKEFRIRLSN